MGVGLGLWGTYGLDGASGTKFESFYPPGLEGWKEDSGKGRKM